MFTSSKVICTLFYHVDMSDLVKREITELAPNGSNYLSWSLDAEIVFDGKNLLHAIKPTNDERNKC